MKRSLNAMFDQASFDVINNLCREQNISYIQDTIHLATKLRNRLLKPSIILPMGSKQVSVSHLKILINSVKKEIHGLVKSDLSMDDRQNFDTFTKITSNSVLDALQFHIPDSEATTTYLKISRAIIDAFMQSNLTPLDRVHKIWYGLYFFRAWKKWILNEYKKSGQTEKFQVYDYFISENAFTCLELNAYGILHLIKKFRTSEKPELFLIKLFNSQHCEQAFRQLRSMTTPNWTRINFSVLELLHMLGRVELQNEIAYFKLQNIINMPRIHNQCKTLHTIHELPSDEELQTVLKEALDNALKTASELNMVVDAEQIRSCDLKKKSKNNNRNTPKKSVPSETDELDASYMKIVNCTNIQTSDSIDAAKIDGSNRFVQVLDEDDNIKVLRKSKIVWLLTESEQKLSKDRLKRVQGVKNTTARKRKNNDHTSSNPSKRNKIQCIFEVLNEIQIGDWCIFENANTHSDNMHAENEVFQKFAVVVVLGFKYVSGKNEKEKQYSLDSAPVSYLSSNNRGVEVNALWYAIKSDLKLEILSKPSFFIDIECYLAHAPNVKRCKNTNDFVFDGNADQMKRELLSFNKRNRYI